MDFEPQPAEWVNRRHQDLDAAYGVMERLRRNPNQPELLRTLQQYLNQFAQRLHELEMEHADLHQQFKDLHQHVDRLAGQAAQRRSRRARVPDEKSA